MEETKALPQRPKKGQSKARSKPPPAPKQKVEPAAPLDPESMFKEGFLKSVYGERPSEQVVTRFPPEPKYAGFKHLQAS